MGEERMDIVLTGHEHFAEGILSSIQKIYGNCDGVHAIPFYSIDSERSLQEKILEVLSDNDVLIFTDIPYGTPFRACATLAHYSEKNIRVLSGTNLAMVLTALTKKDTSVDMDTLVEDCLKQAKESILAFQDESLLGRS